MLGPRLQTVGPDARPTRVTRFLANSAHTAAAHPNAASTAMPHVVHPPVRTEYFTPDPTVSREPWLLVVSALEPYKRTDLVIDAAQQAGIPLKIAGTGSQADALRRAAGAGVEFLGRVPDDELRALFRRARALVFPQVEDFGIIPVEAQSCGCPVIALRAGGALDSLTEETAEFVDEQTVDAFAAAMRRFETRTIDDATCRANALRFAEAVFDTAIDHHVTELLRTGNT